MQVYSHGLWTQSHSCIEFSGNYSSSSHEDSSIRFNIGILHMHSFRLSMFNLKNQSFEYSRARYKTELRMWGLTLPKYRFNTMFLRALLLKYAKVAFNCTTSHKMLRDLWSSDLNTKLLTTFTGQRQLHIIWHTLVSNTQPDCLLAHLTDHCSRRKTRYWNYYYSK